MARPLPTPRTRRKDSRFDDLARALASEEISRRAALGRAAALVGAISLSSPLFAWPSSALGATKCKPGHVRCAGKCCPKGEHCFTPKPTRAHPHPKPRCACLSPRELCPDGSCLDLHTDPHNCGSCGHRCSSGHVCSKGRCTLVCPSGETNCSGHCVHLATDPHNCGTCGHACPTGQTCSGGKCGCPSEHSLCGGVCVALATDHANCGQCGHACGSGEVCSGGNCVSNCGPGETDCGGSCVNTATSVSNCGACGRACSTTNVSELACSGGVCTSTCTAGYSNCSTPSAPTPDDGYETHTDVDVDNCGACGRACSTTNVSQVACSGAVCTSTCLTGYRNCSQPAAPLPDDGCETHIDADVDNCGACGRACSTSHVASSSCSGGRCASTCVAGYSNCSTPSAPTPD
ncbi:MAG: hypothetical protein E6G53_16760, partial [Actinobacteria bacterium]